VRFPERALAPVGTFVGVASWDADAETTRPIDFCLVHNTFVTMFWRSSLLDETVDWLRSHGYDVVEFDTGAWASVGDMFDDLAERRLSYRIVVRGSAWRAAIWTSRKSAPASSMVAKTM
jgi:hypothetical protein